LLQLDEEVVWRDYPKLIHGFGSLTHISDGARRAIAEVGELIGEILDPQATDASDLANPDAHGEPE
jgi:hypothetical protein